jgi:hypothetical protein
VKRQIVLEFPCELQLMGLHIDYESGNASIRKLAISLYSNRLAAITALSRRNGRDTPSPVLDLTQIREFESQVF